MSSSSLCSYCYCIAGKPKCVKPKCMLRQAGCEVSYMFMMIVVLFFCWFFDYIFTVTYSQFTWNHPRVVRFDMIAKILILLALILIKYKKTSKEPTISII